jgi:XRE family aerobic/anaerobic benzoate catabolism transcriptional regulator
MRREQPKVSLLARVGAQVRELRLRADLTVKEIADRSKLSARFINHLEAGTGNISIAGLARVAAALGCSVRELIPPARDDHSSSAEMWRLLNDGNHDDLLKFQRWLEGTRGAESRADCIALIGLRGAGKSTIGQLVARRLKMEFVEVDALVEKAASLSLGEIFTLHGEDYYRRLAHTVLTEVLAKSSPCVLAPGGSVVTDPDSWELIKRRCLTVWLHATPEALMRRMRRQGDLRPMQGRPSPMEELRGLLTRREPLYAESSLRIKTTNKPPATVLAEIVKAMKKRS